MKTLWCWAMVAVLVMTGSARADDKKKPADTKDNASAQDIAALEQAHEAVGTVVSVDASGKSLVFRLEYQQLEVDGNGKNRNAVPNPMRRPHMSHPNQKNVKLVTEHKDFDLQGNADTKVRLQDLPPRVGPDGKPQPYSFKERDDARSPDPSLTGYHAEFENLTAGQTVKVILGHSKDGDKVPVKMIIILPETKPAPMPESKKEKK